MSSSITRNYLYQSGNSDKFYTLSLVATGNTWEVLSHYGRSGTSGKRAVVQPATSYTEAHTVFEKACNKRLKRGYYLAGSSSPVPASPIAPNPANSLAALEAKRQRHALLSAIPAPVITLNPMSLLL
ncbi:MULTISPECIES: WGR domain-containing protein [Pseudomonas]|uniref:WGR domain-containing protein n=1 Tax=Pseudomonas nitroreducens TaxID=46680 RepID=A0A6G6J843_PSENT|nr:MULTISPECIES: WGR domain-containing protein [Pseudomonas]MDU4254125.1 WGR domain-containing protein [Pseudomonas sp.]QIE91240.1 WGR domain-containing protein [Pseudomonas nitroreducens]HBO6306034.1 WGR domain-containing protein [Pseudomonas aeruginosa]